MSSQVTSIPEWYSDRYVFVIGGTGFVGKTLLEKLLTHCPDVAGIYVLVRTKKGSDPKSRLASIFNNKIFDNVRATDEKRFDKVFAIEGSLSEPGLGLNPSDVVTLCDKVSVVFHAAATTRFNDSLRLIVNMNVVATQQVANLCRHMPKIAALVYVSSAYSNCDRTGEIKEKIYPPKINAEQLISLINCSDDTTLSVRTPELLGNHPNTYTFTKCVAEEMLQDCGRGLPIVIVRPSIIAGVWKDPFPGWSDNPFGVTGFILQIATGLMRSVNVGRQHTVDLIPVDIVVNTIVASAWHRGLFQGIRNSKPVIYNCVTTQDNALYTRNFISYINNSAWNYPVRRMLWYPNALAVRSKILHYFLVVIFHIFPAFVFDLALKVSGQKPWLFRMQKKILFFTKTIQHFLTNSWDFKSKNAKILSDSMSKKDKQVFYLNVRDIDWKTFTEKLCIGVKLYVLNEDLTKLGDDKSRCKRMYYLHAGLNTVCIATVAIYGYWRVFTQ